MPSPAERISAIHDDFGEALETLRGVIRHVAEARPEAELRVVILNNVIVALTSTVEETIRDLFKEYLSVLEDASASHSHLRAELQKANFGCAIELLREMKKNADLSGAATLVGDLSKCLNGESGYKLFKDGLTYNKGNFKSGQLTDTAKSSGINAIWEKICDSEEIEDYTGNQTIPSRISSITVTWNDIFSERDIIVHRISQANGWGEAKITDAFELCVLVIKRLTECLIEDAEAQVVHLQGRIGAAEMISRIAPHQGEAIGADTTV